MTKKEFLKEAFSPASMETIEKKTLWLNQDLQNDISIILDHPYPKLRLQYWQLDNQSVWFLDEIGKERPISFGISIKNNQISLIKVLAFRESRGDEIRMQAYTEQFNGVQLNKDDRLNQSIDGITGATMSVNAMKKISRLALKLARITTDERLP